MGKNAIECEERVVVIKIYAKDLLTVKITQQSSTPTLLFAYFFYFFIFVSKCIFYLSKYRVQFQLSVK